MATSAAFRPKICSVSFLNPVPLVWGMLYGPQRDQVELSFELPSVCARLLESGAVDVGLVPVGALVERPMTIYRGTGIACHGPVRSILLISKLPFSEIQTLALDSSSRSSVLLARILLKRRFGVEPAVFTSPPVLSDMLEICDACLVIGDPALRLDPVELRQCGFYVADLGEEWVNMTGLPMVFAVWAGRPELALEQMFLDSWHFGQERIEEIVAAEHVRRGITADLARRYLTSHIVYELGEREYQGMQLYQQYALEVLQSEREKAVTTL